ncbi:MAG: RNA methyltransferase [Oscillospiraceae bacterium]|jgi:TrmH family RNA methyltransferase|nr:RNA methyltransferase [Oscillospiraceae bacterium]
MYQTVTSTQNPRVQALRALHSAKGREAAGCFLAEGAKLCAEALRDAEVALLLADQAKAEAFAPLLAAAPEALLAPAHVLASACEVKTPQGVVAAVRMPETMPIEAVESPLLVLDGVQDPGNVGTMLRTAEAAGFKGALLSANCADPFAPKTVRASMGSVLRLPFIRGDLPDMLRVLAGRGFALLSAELGGTPFAAAARALQHPFALVIGSEGQGVSSEVSAMCGVKVALPMRGRAESLNAAVAAGILMYGVMGDGETLI